jgi:hypothetical protein
MTDQTSSDHLRLISTFEKRSAITKGPKFSSKLLRLAELYRDLAARAEDRRLVREIALGQTFSESCPPGG